MDIGVRAADASVVNQLERTAHWLPISTSTSAHLEDDSSASSAAAGSIWHGATLLREKLITEEIRIPE